jgi:hypothetical protein
MATTHRTVVESRQFRKELRRIESNPIAADELIDGAKWVLARDAYRGVQLHPKSKVWFHAIDPPKVKPVGLYYAFDDNSVHFLSITQG